MDDNEVCVNFFFSRIINDLPLIKPLTKAERDLGDTKNKARQLFRRIDRNAAQEACIESGAFNI
jgi:hypothetical protein